MVALRAASGLGIGGIMGRFFIPNDAAIAFKSSENYKHSFQNYICLKLPGLRFIAAKKGLSPGGSIAPIWPIFGSIGKEFGNCCIGFIIS